MWIYFYEFLSIVIVIYQSTWQTFHKSDIFIYISRLLFLRREIYFNTEFVYINYISYIKCRYVCEKAGNIRTKVNTRNVSDELVIVVKEISDHKNHFMFLA